MTIWRKMTAPDRMTVITGLTAIAAWLYYRGRKYL